MASNGVLIAAAYPAALDLMLKPLVASSEFTALPHKNWAALSKTVPGTTAKQCERRYDELLKQEYKSSPGFSNTPSPKSHKVDDVSESRPSRPGSAKGKNSKTEIAGSTVKSSQHRPASADLGPVMVIHVCDEAKNVKKDFHCPRDLLIEEMKYFAEYLSTDAQRWEEVDISVHCDVQIFDWLMKFVKRSLKESTVTPQLEASNVISILISSDFLKMDNLVEECINFCHEHMSAIVAAPCNMNCINDKLVTRIADLFTHTEADDVKDKKDKFKSKLFQKKIEKLFDEKHLNKDSPESAVTLFKCGVCMKILTNNLQSRVKCLRSRMNIDRKGELIYYHNPDSSWDVNDYLCELKNELKTWRDVYWRVWGVINYLACSRCGETFPCAELAYCKYHPQLAEFEASSAVGVYPCCGQKVFRFDPARLNTGCKLRDHVVDLVSSDGGSVSSVGKPASRPSGGAAGRQSEKQAVYNDLLAHRDAICVQYNKLISVDEGDDEVDVFALDEKVFGAGSDANLGFHGSDIQADTEAKPRLQALTVERAVSCDDIGASDDDEVGDLEDAKIPRRLKTRKSRITVQPQAILMDPPRFSSTKSRKWDVSRSLRWNQDAQREEDQQRMNDIIVYLSKLRMRTGDKCERTKQREYAGGIFSRLEAQWRAVNMPPPKAANTFQIRNKPKIGSLQK